MSQFGIYFVASKDRMRQWIDLDKLIAEAEERNSPDIESIGSQQDELEGQMSAAKVYLDDVVGTDIE